MLVVRPVVPEDLEALLALAAQAGMGLTMLPCDRDLLEQRIAEARYGFERGAGRPGGESYLFVMEDRDARRVVGTGRVVSKVGGFEPFYAYRLATSVHESVALGVRKEIGILHLVALHSGPSAVGGLFVAPSHRARGGGRLMSLSRFLFMGTRPQAFESEVIAEMRGIADAEGRSPFWEAVGRHFFDMDFPQADHLSAKDKRFIAELMPTHPLYIAMLPEEARSSIGRVHEESRPAFALLEEEGFTESGMADIFDAGPIVSCRLERIRTVRESAEEVIREIAAGVVDAPPCLIGNTLRDFRACVEPVAAAKDGGVRLAAAAAEALGVTTGDRVRYAPLRPGAFRRERPS
jgi:arginine N-succinyltransferase